MQKKKRLFLTIFVALCPALPSMRLASIPGWRIFPGRTHRDVGSRGEGGIHIDFSGKANARKLSRRVRPRVARTIKKYSAGSEEDQARNLLIEGDNLQAMATLFRERGPGRPDPHGPAVQHRQRLAVQRPLGGGPERPGHRRVGQRGRRRPAHEVDAVHVAAAPDDEDDAEAERGAGDLHRLPRAVPARPDARRAVRPGEPARDHQLAEELRAHATTSRHVSTATEYVLVYAKDEEKAKTVLLPRSEDDGRALPIPDGDPRLWKPATAAAQGEAHQGHGVRDPVPVHRRGASTRRAAAVGETSRSRSWAGCRQWGCEYELKDLEGREEASGDRRGRARRGAEGQGRSSSTELDEAHEAGRRRCWRPGLGRASSSA